MRRFSILLALCAVVATTGCPGPGSFDGEVAGRDLAVADVFFIMLPLSPNAQPWPVVVLSDDPEACDSLKANRWKAGSTWVGMMVARWNSDFEALPIDEGEYTVGRTTGRIAFAEFTKMDDECENAVPGGQRGSQSGLIEVEDYEIEESIRGTFDITFGDQNDNVEGHFDAPFCIGYDSPFLNPNCE